ncbi:hypothetical protein AKI39_15200 [Bordetella sp. H567]|uniref:Bug family tripartite tricarboxylate transporter substrate binding protein n=1 Tax=Bordetella sp. H567 TaxID=1697043 RepID=UPI00081CF2A5|nr:tripartite tricarboxylate transporter substrate-binding protein [Bordetella sp. H567]AOB31756.1 hypothetical protein AKI39_15200 [Bordetella sp. H567]
MNRRTIIKGMGASACILSFAPRAASAYPDRPIRVILGLAPGGGVDRISRLVTEQMSVILGRPMIVENRPGALGAIAVDMVGSAAPDGYTLLACGAGEIVVTPAFDAAALEKSRRLRPVVLFAESPNLLIAHPSVKDDDLRRMLKGAQTDGSTSIGVSGTGGTQFLTLAVLKSAGLDITSVPYKGAGPALTDLLGGHIPFALLGAPACYPAIRSGGAKPVAIGLSHRSSILPDVPTLAEALQMPGLDSSTWHGMMAPAKTPDAVVNALANAALRALKDSVLRSHITDLGAELRASPPEEFSVLIETQLTRNTDTVKRLKLSLT